MKSLTIFSGFFNVFLFISGECMCLVECTVTVFFLQCSILVYFIVRFCLNSIVMLPFGFIYYLVLDFAVLNVKCF